MATLLLERADWRMRTAPGKSLHPHGEMPVGEVYVHQTAGRDPVHLYPSGDDRPEDAFTALNEFAIVGKDYTAVDYSMLVHTGPSLRTTIGVARGEYVPAATLDRNRQSKAVCLLGWFGPPDPRYAWTFDHAREPFDQELWAIAEAIVTMIRRGWVRPDAQILGHRDNPSHPNATACPGEWLYAKLPVIRAYVASLLAGPQPEPPPFDMPLQPAVDAFAVVAQYCACHPGNGSQGALWDVVLPHITGLRIPVGDPRRTEFEQASRFPGDGRLRRAWEAIVGA